MIPYSIKLAGGYTRAGYAKSGVLTSGPTFYPVTKAEENFSCSSTDGDFVTPNPHSYKMEQKGRLNGKLVEVNPSGTYVINEGDIFNHLSPSGILNLHPGLAALDPHNKCLGKLFEQIRADVDLSIDIYQGTQLLRSLSSLSDALRSPLRTLGYTMKRLAEKPGWREMIKWPASKWLEWQYGLKPTLQTIYDLTGEVIEAVSSSDGVFMVKARASEINRFTGTKYYVSNIAGMPDQIDFEDSRREEILLKFVISDADRYALSQFSSLNPVSFIYENIRFSFVLDWIIDVGGYIRLMETAVASGLTFHSGYKTTSRRTRLTATVKSSYKASNGIRYVPTVSPKSFHLKELRRSILTEMPLPHIPQVKVSLGTERLLSAAALVAGLLGFQPPKLPKRK